MLRSDRTVNYFSIRNNDPGVDGVFISQGVDIDTHIPLAMTPNNYGIAFARSFNNGTPFPSLDRNPLYSVLSTKSLSDRFDARPVGVASTNLAFVTRRRSATLN